MSASVISAPWIVGPIVVPLAAATLLFLLGHRYAHAIAWAASLLLLIILSGLTTQIWQHGPVLHHIGGWGAPLGIDLRADGLSLLMLCMSIAVGVGVTIYALAYFPSESVEQHDETTPQAPHADMFWPLWFFLWAGLHALFLSADLFNLYVTLEIVGLSAVALVITAGSRTAVTAGMRYLLTSLVGSMSYLFGVALLYVAFGALDMATLSTRIVSTLPAKTSLVFMTTGLLLKTALFPLHFWLPPAHASAPAPVSAVLSALVVKASFYLLLRLWIQVFPVTLTISAGLLLGLCGAGAVLWASTMALRQQRLKLLIAYSTVAQIGYLFIVVPLLGSSPWGLDAWQGGVYHMLSHACAKAAMFMAAGTIMHIYGHDRIADLAGISHVAPYSLFAFALAGVSLMGLPPSGGFLSKWLLITAALGSGQWWWAVVIIVGGLLTAGYIFGVIRYGFVETSVPLQPVPLIPQSMEVIPVLLALLAVLLGFTAALPLTLLRIGAPLIH